MISQKQFKEIDQLIDDFLGIKPKQPMKEKIIDGRLWFLDLNHTPAMRGYYNYRREGKLMYCSLKI